MRRIGLALALVAVLAMGGWLYAPHWHPSDGTWPVQGIDVSHYQGKIDWSLLPGQGVDFAYIKATEGGDYRDDRFAENWRGADRTGIARGAYHFFTLCRPGADQAANFIAAVPNDPAMLAPAVDLEAGGNCAERPSKAAFIAEVATFIRLVEAHFDKPVTLYLTQEFDTAYRVSALIPRRLWLRSLLIEPGWGARPWSVWQASSLRRLDGIKGRVDWNVARP